MPAAIAASLIAQQAFTYVELSPISSFGDDTPQAQAATTAYPLARRAVLGAYDWSFARTWATLAVAEQTGPIDAELPYLYAIPGDLLQLRWVEDGVTWRRDGAFIRADTSTAPVIGYTRDVTNENLLPAEVQDVMALRMAILLAPKWLGSRTKRADLKTDYRDGLKEAKDQDKVSASDFRWNDGPDEGDWANEATR